MTISTRYFVASLAEDGTIADYRFQSSGSKPPAEPMNVTVARMMVRAVTDQLEEVREALWRVTDLLPLPEDHDAMCNDLIPPDEITYIEGAVQLVLEEYLEPAMAVLQKAADATERDLRQDFEARHARYREERPPATPQVGVRRRNRFRGEDPRPPRPEKRR